MDTDADRQVMIESLGGVRVQSNGGEFTAVFDYQYVGDGVGEADVESRSPTLTCRTSDFDAAKVRKGQMLSLPIGSFKVRRHQPDGTGMSTVILEQP